MSLSAAHAAELGQALDALEALVAARLEERRSGHGPGGILGRRLGGAPLPDVFAGDGPLARTVEAGGLTGAEAVTLLAALAREVDDGYDALFAALADRPGVDGLTGEVARTLASGSAAERLAFPDLLARDAPLVACGLVELDASDPVLAGRLRAGADFARWALGVQGRPGALGPDFPARPLHTVHTLADVVLPRAQQSRLEAVVARIRDRDRVVGDWGFGRHHDNVSGLVALFHGPPGTGKSMAAAAVGRAAGLPVWRVDLSQLVSKYVGETAKQLTAVFTRARREGWLLVFDEADAVFGKRTEVSDAHDRYANQDVSHLLTLIEGHSGTVILTTNLLGNLDEAFQRRVHVVIGFEAPGLEERDRLWAAVVPPDTPLAPDVDRAALARRYPLSGAQIRDATLDAAYAAAADGGTVTAAMLDDAVRGQYARAGRSVPAAPG